MYCGGPIFTAALIGHKAFLKPFLLTLLEVCSESQVLPGIDVSDLDIFVASALVVSVHS